MVSTDSRFKMVAFDQNGTLLDAHATIELARGTKNFEKVKELIEANVNGKLPLDETINGVGKLLKGVSVMEAERVARTIKLMPGTKETMKALKRAGIKTASISTGFSVIAKQISEALGMDYAICNELEVKDGKFTGKVIHADVADDEAKDRLVKEILEKENLTKSECVAVGDSAADISMFRAAGKRIAFNAKPALLPHADMVVKKKDLREILPHIIEGYSQLSPSDVELLSLLQGDARTSLKELGTKMGLSSAGISKKIQKLEERNIIKRFTVDISEEQVGAKTAYIMARDAPSKIKKLSETLTGDENVTECHTTVDGTLLLKVVSHMADMETTLTRIFDLLRTEGIRVENLILPRTHKQVTRLPEQVLTRQQKTQQSNT